MRVVRTPNHTYDRIILNYFLVPNGIAQITIGCEISSIATSKRHREVSSGQLQTAYLED